MRGGEDIVEDPEKAVGGIFERAFHYGSTRMRSDDLHQTYMTEVVNVNQL